MADTTDDRIDFCCNWPGIFLFYNVSIISSQSCMEILEGCGLDDCDLVIGIMGLDEATDSHIRVLSIVLRP